MSSVFLDTWTRLSEIENHIEDELASAGLDLKPIEAYILKELYTENCQHASTLAKKLGRAATSFTPILDKVQDKGYLHRVPDGNDRRAVFICLTVDGDLIKNRLLQTLERIEKKLGKK